MPNVMADLVQRRQSTEVSCSYNRLEGGYVRLIKLNAGETLDELSMTMYHAKLENEPVFEALSYTWGTSDKGHRVHCGPESIPITANLASALRHLRKPDESRTLWIDQLCINQEDTSERNQQVSLMGRIYSQAKNVLIWIGDADGETAMAFSFVPILLAYFPECQAEEALANPSLVAKRAIPLVGSAKWQALSKLFVRPFFRREWIVQEIALARSAEVHCGDFTIGWKELALAYAYQRDYVPLDVEDVHDSVAAITKLRTRKYSDLVEALFLSYKFRCTDPRDKVYAMLGLNPGHTLEPDYKLSVENVYLQTASSMILALGNLDILCCVFHPKTMKTLPSWVPDWQTQVIVRRTLCSSPGQHRQYLEDRPLIGISFSEDLRALVVNGRLIDTVAAVSNTFPENGSTFICGAEWEDFAREASRLGGWPFPDTYWRTILAGTNTIAPKSDFELRSMYDSWKNLRNRSNDVTAHYEPLTNLPDENEKGSEFGGLMGDICVGRRLFKTENHSLGLGPSETHVGDVVCFLASNPQPFVLREADDFYELVGEGFVQGFMHEADPSVRSKNPQDAREFIIR